MKKKGICKVEYIKIFSRVSRADYERLTMIRQKYGFKSNYEIIQYLMHCFLRVADPDNDDQIEPVPVEIEQMFFELSEADKKFMFVKPKRRCPHKTPDKQ